MTTTTQTESRYRATAERLIGKCLTEFRMAEPDLTDQILADWMISHRTDWSAATWRQYRSALTFHLGPHMMALLGTAELPPAAPRGRKTSGLKEKKLPPDDLLKLFSHLIAKVTENPLEHYSPSYFAATMLFLGVFTGMRPCEWHQTQIASPEDSADIRLKVRNAKATGGRAHGECRDINFPDFNQQHRILLLTIFEIIDRLVSEGRLETAMNAARRALLRANRALWPNRRKTYTLYSSRHQAASNWKTVRTREEIAALMGHASMLTAATHYGRRSAGRTTVMPDVAVAIPTPSVEDIAAVRAINARAPSVDEAAPEGENMSVATRFEPS
jgi:integrase